MCDTVDMLWVSGDEGLWRVGKCDGKSRRGEGVGHGL